MDAKFTPGPWKTQRTDWCGDPVEHDIYIAGNAQESCDEDDPDAPTYLIATAVAIVEGNATSRETTEANAYLISAAPDLYAAAKMAESAISHHRVPQTIADAAIQVVCQLGPVMEALRAAIARAEKGGGA